MYSVICSECGDAFKLHARVCCDPLAAIAAATGAGWTRLPCDRWLCPSCLIAEAFGKRGRDMTNRGLTLERLPPDFVNRHLLELHGWFSGSKLTKAIRLTWPDDHSPEVSHATVRRALIAVGDAQCVAILPNTDYDGEIISRYAGAWSTHDRLAAGAERIAADVRSALNG